MHSEPNSHARAAIETPTRKVDQITTNAHYVNAQTDVALRRVMHAHSTSSVDFTSEDILPMPHDDMPSIEHDQGDQRLRVPESSRSIAEVTLDPDQIYRYFRM